MTISTIAEPEFDVVQRALDDRLTIEKAAEQILWDLSPGVSPTARQWSILRAAGFERSDLDGQLGRVSTVRRLMLAAGTPEQFAEAEKAAIEAASNEDAERPKFEEQLAKIQAALDRLNNLRRAAEKKLENMRSARERLREPPLLPVHIRAAADGDAHAIQLRHAERIGEVETELAVIRGLKMIGGGTEQARLHWESAHPEMLSRHNGVPFADPEVWRLYVERRSLDEPALETELAQLKMALRDDLRPVAELYDYYVSKL